MNEKVICLTPETYSVNGVNYYMEYTGSNFIDRRFYRLINLDKAKVPVKFSIDKDFRVVEIVNNKFTEEEAAVCREKGMFVNHDMIQKPKMNFVAWISYVRRIAVRRIKSLLDPRISA